MDALSRLAELEKEAASGPWYVEEIADEENGAGAFFPILGGGVRGSMEEHCIGTTQSYGQGLDQCQKDADLIVALRNAAAALIQVAQMAEQLALANACGILHSESGAWKDVESALQRLESNG